MASGTSNKCFNKLKMHLSAYTWRIMYIIIIFTFLSLHVQPQLLKFLNDQHLKVNNTRIKQTLGTIQLQKNLIFNPMLLHKTHFVQYIPDVVTWFSVTVLRVTTGIQSRRCVVVLSLALVARCNLTLHLLRLSSLLRFVFFSVPCYAQLVSICSSHSIVVE